MLIALCLIAFAVGLVPPIVHLTRALAAAARVPPAGQRRPGREHRTFGSLGSVQVFFFKGSHCLRSRALRPFRIGRGELQA